MAQLRGAFVELAIFLDTYNHLVDPLKVFWQLTMGL
jgi:hypothetical protein